MNLQPYETKVVQVAAPAGTNPDRIEYYVCEGLVGMLFHEARCDLCFGPVTRDPNSCSTCRPYPAQGSENWGLCSPCYTGGSCNNPQPIGFESMQVELKNTGATPAEVFFYFEGRERCTNQVLQQGFITIPVGATRTICGLAAVYASGDGLEAFRFYQLSGDPAAAVTQAGDATLKVSRGCCTDLGNCTAHPNPGCADGYDPSGAVCDD